MAPPQPITRPIVDADLDGMAAPQLLAVVRKLTAQIEGEERVQAARRVRRTRAFRRLRALDVQRTVIAEAGHVTEGGVRNLIHDLNRREDLGLFL